MFWVADAIVCHWVDNYLVNHDKIKGVRGKTGRVINQFDPNKNGFWTCGVGIYWTDGICVGIGIGLGKVIGDVELSGCLGAGCLSIFYAQVKILRSITIVVTQREIGHRAGGGTLYDQVKAHHIWTRSCSNLTQSCPYGLWVARIGKCGRSRDGIGVIVRIHLRGIVGNTKGGRISTIQHIGILSGEVKSCRSHHGRITGNKIPGLSSIFSSDYVNGDTFGNCTTGSVCDQYEINA